MNEKITQSTSMTMLKFAEINERDALLEHINNALETYRRIGLSVESFTYYPTEERVDVSLLPTKSHEGHTGIVQGGFLTNLIDASSGALAMTLVDKNNIAFTQSINTTFHKTALSGKELVARSHMSTKQLEDKRQINIVTEVYQEDALVASAEVSLTRANAAILKRLNPED